jgi:exopolysaccharide biosynthesis polyprenyl glycosylphosphotransferase
MPETEPALRRRPASPLGRLGRRLGREQPPDAIEEARPGQAIEVRDRRYRRALALSDVAAVAVALVVTVPVAGEEALRAATFLGLPLIVLAAKLHGLYDRDELLVRKTTIDEAPQLFQLATLFTLVFWTLDGPLVHGTLDNVQVLVLWSLVFGLSLGGRRVARAAVRRSTPAERCVLIGDAAAYDRLRHKLETSGVNAELVGRMSLRRPALAPGARAADTADLRELLAWASADRIVIEPQCLPDAEMLDLVRAAKGVGVRVSLLPRVLDVVGTAVEFDHLHGMTLLGVRRFGLTRSSRLLKRTFDVAGAGLGLVAVAPLMALIALAIKLDGGGPVLFRQTRVGRDGERFRICKFRTMVADAEERKAALLARSDAEGGLFKMADDPRVTRVGRLLRRTSLDELPQLLNVLAGSMSLVGPRPLVVDEDEQITGWDRHRLRLTPGMTGHWQILGSARVPLHEMVKIDYLYVASWSLWTDLKILVRTVPYMLGRRGM